MQDIQTRVHVGPSAIKVWTTTTAGEELARAKMPANPGDPRALATLLRGLALWAAKPMRVVISADRSLASSRVLALFATAHWPGEDPLLRLVFRRDQHGDEAASQGGAR